MPLPSLTDPLKASDAGGVAGRIGYDFQAHVAAGFVLDMIADPSLVQVECETADDVTLRWDVEGKPVIEYVQVKSGDADSKWTITDLVGRTAGKVGSSLMEKSLACDVTAGNVCFRFVTTRDVRGELVLFKVRRDNREAIKDRFDKLITSFSGKHKSFASPQKRTSREWAATMLWDVEATEEHLERKNVLKLLRQAEGSGQRPSSQCAEAAYDDLLRIVEAASKASRVTAPQQKAISRDEAWTWWKSRLAIMSLEGQRTLKVYNVSTDTFFAQIVDLDESNIFRSLQAYDAEFDGGVWRREELAAFLGEWLPEITLPPKVLASYSHLEARTLTRKALEAVSRSGSVAFDRLIAELMLHAILRQYRESEPIACKLFTQSAGIVHTNSAHIIHTSDKDEIWLGQARLATATDHQSVISQTIIQIEQSFERDVLKRERDVIVQLRDPDHLRATNIERAFAKNAKMDDFIDVVRIPILIAYDSSVIGLGHSADYVSALKSEVESSYQLIKSGLPAQLASAKIHVFLVPVECATSLTASFLRYINGN